MALTDGSLYELIDDRAGNDLNRGSGEFIVIGDNDIVPNGSAGTTATATTINSVTGASAVFTLPFVGSTSIPDQFGLKVPYDPALTGPYTLAFTNDGTTITEQTQSVAGIAPPPFASSVVIGGSSLNPTFSWSYPAGSVDGVFFDIYDKSLKNAAGNADLVYSNTIAGTVNSFTVPTALDGGLSLIEGHQYTVDLYGVKSRDPTQPLSNPNSLGWSESYFDFTPLTAATPQVSLPIVNAQTGAYQFSATVVAGQTLFIDPAIAVGYTYQIGVGDPNFASVQLPTIQTSDYIVSYLEGGTQQAALVAPGTVYTFPTGGVSAFTVTGVNPALALNPANSSAFVTGLVFAGSGSFTGTQTPLTTVIEGNGQTHQTLNGTAGDDNFYATAAFTTINGDGGSDAVTTTGGYDTFNQGALGFTLSNPGTTDVLTLGGPHNTVNGDYADYSITDSVAGQNQVNLGDGNNTITLAGSNNVVSSGDATNTVVFSAGGNTALFDSSQLTDQFTYSESVTFSGEKNVYKEDLVIPSHAGSYVDGTAIVSGGDGYGQFTSTHGSFTLTTGGQYNTVSAGDGTADITPGSGHDSVTIDPPFYALGVFGGTDAVHLAGKYNSVTAFAHDLTVDGGQGSSSYNFAYDVDLEAENFNQDNAPQNYTVTAGGSYNHFSLFDVDNNTITAGDGGATVLIANAYILDDNTGLPTTTPITNYGLTTLTFAGLDNTLTDTGGGPVTATGGTGQGTFTLGSGNDSLTTGGVHNTVTAGAGTDTIIAGIGQDTITLNGTNAHLILQGSGDAVFLHAGASGTISGADPNLHVTIAPGIGAEVLTGLATDPHAVFTLTGGAGGFTTTAQIVAALQPDGSGGTILHVGSGSFDFAGTASSSLSAAMFAIKP